VNASTWDTVAARRDEARKHGAEGVMLKRLESPYAIGRHRGAWWEWKTGPLMVNAVLLYAERSQGHGADQYADFTFALWRDGDLVPFAKTRSGLTDDEILEVDRFVRENTREQFGPVRSVVPELVFELAFEGVQRSSRHKSGIIVRAPRVVRWRKDKRPEEADSLSTIGAMLDALENAGKRES
jgi:DNA ligase-1